MLPKLCHVPQSGLGAQHLTSSFSYWVLIHSFSYVFLRIQDYINLFPNHLPTYDSVRIKQQIPTIYCHLRNTLNVKTQIVLR